MPSQAFSPKKSSEGTWGFSPFSRWVCFMHCSIFNQCQSNRTLAHLSSWPSAIKCSNLRKNHTYSIVHCHHPASINAIHLELQGTFSQRVQRSPKERLEILSPACKIENTRDTEEKDLL